MKRILMILWCTYLFGACEKAEVPSVYSGPDGINFYYDQSGPYDADPYPDSDETGSLSLSQQTDTLWYRIDVLGNVSDKERKFSLKQSTLSSMDSSSYYTGIATVAVSGVNYIGFDDPRMEKYLVIPPQCSYILVPIILLRNPDLDFGSSFSKTFCLHFEIVPNEEVKILDPRFYRAKAKFTQSNY